MKKYIFYALILWGLTACNNQANTASDDTVVMDREAIVKQIDSLNKILARLDRKSNIQREDIPYINIDTVRERNFTAFLELRGNLQTDGNVTISPSFMGEVKKIYVKEGQRIWKNQPILKLDDAVLRNQISEVQTQYALAKTAYERQKRLWKQKIGSEMQYLQAKTKKEALARKLNTLRAQLKKTVLRSPISGTLDDLMVKEGEMAGPQRPVARVVSLKNVYMEADVSEKFLTKIKKGTPAQIVFPILGKSIHARVSYVGSFIHPNNRTFKIRVDIPNKDRLLKPNLTGVIKIKTLEVPHAVVIPLDILQEDLEGNNFVFVLKPTDKPEVFEVKKQYVQVGEIYKDLAWIKEGLKPGELIPLLGSRGLTEGDLVKIAQPQNQEEQAQ